MIIELWGVRGSLPTATTNNEYQKKIHKILEKCIKNNTSDIKEITSFLKKIPADISSIYGGNTTCATVTSQQGNLYILDCGTGIRPLGDALMKGSAGTGKDKINIFLTHTHWDHIQGLPFFKPLYMTGNNIHFYSTIEDLHERFSYQQAFRFFPKNFDDMEATKHFHLLQQGIPIQLEDNLTVESFPLRHPGGSTAYKFKEGDKTFIFATDAEFTGHDFDEGNSIQDTFFANADLLIIDSQYTLDEAFMKFDWGHTAYTMAVNCGIKWKAKELVLTHHEPSYSDKKIYSIYKDAVTHRNAMQCTSPKIFMAREGMKFNLQ